MSLHEVRSAIAGIKNNLKGWRTNRRIIVIESDDWGSVRMPSKGAYEALLSERIKVDQCPFLKYDTIASSTDLTALFELLRSIKDSRDKPAQITANVIVGNPDFKKIEEGSYNEYFFEDFRVSINRQYPRGNVFEQWQQGQQEKLFFPQLHGREHVNFFRWLFALKEKNPHITAAFRNRVFGLSKNVTEEVKASYLAAFDYDQEEQFLVLDEIVGEAQSIFCDAFGYYSASFIAPNYVWNERLEKVLAENHVRYIQSGLSQLLPQFDRDQGRANMKHFTGETNDFAQIYLVRNCIFEPSTSVTKDHVGQCLNQVYWSFKMNKPAIISTHRLNFIGALEEKNRTENLAKFNDLLTTIVRRWPNVEFMNTVDLGKLISNEC